MTSVIHCDTIGVDKKTDRQETKMNAKVAEIKKLENGNIAVRWEGKRKFNIVEDAEIAAYLIYTITRSEKQVFNNINSRLK